MTIFLYSKKQNEYSKIIDELNRDLPPHEQIKRFRLVADEWNQQNGFLSPTLKLRRAPLNKKYQHLIEEIYSKAENVPAKGNVFTQIYENEQIKSFERKIARVERRRKMVELRREGRLLRVADRFERRISRKEEKMAMAQNPRRKMRLERRRDRLEFRRQIREERVKTRFERRLIRLAFKQKKFSLKIAMYEQRIAKRK